MAAVPSHSYITVGTFDYAEDNSIEDDHYDYNAIPTASPENLDEVFNVTLQVIYVVIILLGICGNGLVIWIAIFKVKRTVNTTWYLSLAFSDFIYCATLPFSITQIATSQWDFGYFMCKFNSFVLCLNMFSSIFLMVIISVDRCVAVTFPVWAQNHRTLKKAAVLVVIAWLISMTLSVPSLVMRTTKDDEVGTRCYNDFESALPGVHTSIVVVRFVLSFVLPLAIIITCYSVIILRLWAKKMSRSTKPFKVMTALIITFIISWLPYHICVLLEINLRHIAVKGIKISMMLASANSCMNPLLYAFMGRDFQQQACSSVISKIQHALIEEEHSSKGTGQVSSKRSTSQTE